jgi:hypothetical protein
MAPISPYLSFFLTKSVSESVALAGRAAGKRRPPRNAGRGPAVAGRLGTCSSSEGFGSMNPWTVLGVVDLAMGDRRDDLRVRGVRTRSVLGSPETATEVGAGAVAGLTSAAASAWGFSLTGVSSPSSNMRMAPSNVQWTAGGRGSRGGLVLAASMCLSTGL